MRLRLSIFLLLAFGLSASIASARETPPPIDIPRLEGIRIDGQADDWGEQGYRVALLGDAHGGFLAAKDFDAGFRLGWDARGLLILVTVQDNAAFESADDASIWTRDSVQFFVAPRVSDRAYYQVMIAPGRAPEHNELRTHTADQRKGRGVEKIAVEAARSLTDTGYSIEALLPWANLDLEARPGETFALQILVNDADPGAEPFQAQWRPIPTVFTTLRMNTVRLAEAASPAVFALARPEYAWPDLRVNITAEGLPKNATIELFAGDQALGNVALREENGRQIGTIRALRPDDPKHAVGTLRQDGNIIGTVCANDAERARAEKLMWAEINFKPNVFSGSRFPECDFLDPGAMRNLLGEYRIHATFYDHAYARVETAEKPGRYGAVIDVESESVKPMRRFRTLCRLPDASTDFLPWRNRDDLSVHFPKEYGINEATPGEYHDDIRYYLWDVLSKSYERHARSGALLATLYETPPTGAPVRANRGLEPTDRQWWAGLKRSLYATDRRWPDAMICPKPIKGKVATVLHPGSDLQAGMKPGATAAIDALLKEWAADSDEAFAVCLARDGVVFLYEAYGTREGKPMTVTNKSWMASITKLMSATLMMMCVDQGRVKLDDPVSEYLPAFRNIPVERPLTVRDLYVHLSGLQNHWGDNMADLEEMVADYYPALPVGVEHFYGGSAYALGGKIVEAVSGEAVPAFFLKHLLDPLDCPNTDVMDTCGSAQCAPMDIAKIGQMLLNRGAYGSMRFFSEKTFEKMLPHPLEGYTTPAGEDIEWGIGTVWRKIPGLGIHTFGHGASSAATLAIDPENHLLIVMTRNHPGKNFDQYHERFLKTIADNLAKPSKKKYK